MSNNKIEPRILKGTRDFLPTEVIKRNKMMQTIKTIFEKFGYSPIEPPIISPAETLLGKYGDEGEKLTYQFESKGGTKMALPYDLTVPFARYVGANWRNLPIPFKRYQIQRVWRAERPQKGRLREFYQCDIDTIGTKSLLVETEVAKVIIEVFETFKLKDFVIKINSRKLINAILKSMSVEENQVVDVIRLIDKLDKIGQEGVQKELENIGIKNAKEILELLKPEKDNQTTTEKLKDYDISEMNEFFDYCESLSIPQKYLQFDPSLARGLDYYTGLIFEVISQTGGYGTICAGGRYDNLCSLFCDQDFSGMGVSFGFERIYLILDEIGYFQKENSTSQALVTLFDEESTKDSLEIYNQLIEGQISSEIYFEPTKIGKQFKYADKKEIQFVVIYGPEEKENETVTLKNMKTGKQKTIPKNQLVSYINGYYESEE